MEQAIGDINLEMLKELSEAHGISGNEKEVSRMMKKWMSPYADEVAKVIVEEGVKSHMII